MGGDEKKPYLSLNSFLVKDEHKDLNVSEFLKSSAQVNSYDIEGQTETPTRNWRAECTSSTFR